MARGKSAAVPRKYVRAAMCGLRDVSWCRKNTLLLRSNGGKMLDKALRYAEAYQESSARRWKESTGYLPSITSSIFLKHEKALYGGSVQTLQHLASVEKEENGDFCVAEEDAAVEGQQEEGLSSLTFFEKQQARLHAALQQWVVYASLRCSRADFLVRQSRISAVLLLCPLRVVPSSRSNPDGANSLEASLRRRGAQAYVDLLVHHCLNMEREEELEALYAASTILEKQQPANKMKPIMPLITLPFIHSSCLNASWKRSFALLSWAMHFNNSKQQEQQRHVSSADIACVLGQCAQQFGERVSGPGAADGSVDGHSVVVRSAAEQIVIARLQRWWTAAREVEQQNPGLAEACRLDRTALSQIHVEGKRVILMASAATPAMGDAGFAELLFQQRWKDVLGHIQQTAAETLRRYYQFAAGAQRCEERVNNGRECDDVAFIAKGDAEGCSYAAAVDLSFPSAFGDDPMTLFFNRPRPLVVKSKLWVHAAASREGRVPHALLNARMTQAEAELLRNPPTAGLRCGHFAAVGKNCGPQQTIEFTNNEKSDTFFYSSTSFTLLKKLRRKLWIHAQLPRHVPHSLVRFEGTGSTMLPYVLRCPAKELLPWFMLCNIAAVAQEQQVEEVDRVLQRVRTQVLYTLFSPVTYYASFQEYCADLVLQLGCVLVPLRLMRVAVRSLFCPPSLFHFYDVSTGRRIPTETTCRQLLWGSLEASVAGVDGDSTSFLSFFLRTTVNFLRRLRTDSDALLEFFICKAASLRNYHVSTWIEACSKVEAFSTLVDILVREMNDYGPPLLSPEAAAAFLTAFVIDNVTAGEEKKMDTTAKVLQELGVVYFVVPADRALGAVSYFKGVYNERFITSTTFEWTASSWDGSEALLVGRSIRRITKDPTTTKEVFFRVNRRRLARNHHSLPSVEFRVPELRLRLMMVDLLKAKVYFASQGQFQSKINEKERITGSESRHAIVARNLPFGVIAVNKPAGVSTTLHSSYPHMIGFLSRFVPWKDAVAPPAIFQHGLVNRIDVGTSGLLLVADTEASLVAARRASIVGRRVEKTYRALVVHCSPPASRVGVEECWYLSSSGIITHNVIANGADFSLQMAANDPQKKGRLPLVSTDIRAATTFYRVLRYFPVSGVYDLEVRLCSGRRHQIRQHFAQLWHPLVGDSRYHERAKLVGERLGLYRPALHAFRITLSPFFDVVEETNGGTFSAKTEDLEKTVVECPLPDDLQRALRLLCEEEGKTGAAFV